MALHEHISKFILRGEDHTRAAIRSAKHGFHELDRSAHRLQGTLVGFAALYGFERVLRSVVDTEVKLQSMRYTLDAATGSMAKANQEMSFIVQTSDKLGISIKNVGEYYARMAAIATDSGYSLKEFHQEFVNISGGMRVLHLDARHTQLAWLALQEIMAQGHVKLRHLTRQLSIDFPTALQAMALGLHTTTGRLIEMAHAGTLVSHTALAGLSRGLKELYGPQVQAASQGLQADMQRVGNAITEAVRSAENTGAFQNMGDAMNSLADAIKDPAFRTAFATFVSDMAKLARLSLTQFTNWMNGVDIMSSKIAKGIGIMPHQLGVGDLGSTLKQQLKNAHAQYEQIWNKQKETGYMQKEWPWSKTVFKSSLTPSEITRGNNLRQIIINLRRIEAEGPKAVAAYNKMLAASTKPIGGHHPTVDQMSPAQQSALKTLTTLQGSLQKKIDGFSKKAQLAHEALKAFKPGTKGYSEAAAMVKIIDQEQKQLDLLAKQKKFRQDLAKQTKHEIQQEVQHTAALMNDAEKWKEQINPVNKVNAEIKKLNEELKRGYLTQTQYNKAVALLKVKAKEGFGTVNQFTVQAARNLQDVLGQTFMDVFSGKGNVIQNFAHSFSKAIQQMIAQILAFKAATALFGQGFASGKSNTVGGLLGGLFSMFSTTSQRTGGMVGSQSAPRVSVPAIAFAGAPHFSTGGFPGLSADAVPIIAHKGEEVLTKGDPRNALNGGHRPAAMNVTINAQGAGPDETAKIARFGGDLQRMWRGDFDHKKAYGDWPT